MADGGSGDTAAPCDLSIGLALPDSNTICARRTSECGMLCERTIARNCSRFESLITNAVLGLPILHTYGQHSSRPNAKWKAFNGTSR
jgi:hypothetical protein